MPANPGDNDLWIPFETDGQSGFDVATAPKKLTTKAIRVSLLRGADDSLTQADEKSEYETGFRGGNEGLVDAGNKETGPETTRWQGFLDGIKLISRRFDNVARSAKLLTNSGQAAPDRSWTADRTTPLSEDNPASYALAWNEEQSIRGLAIKEIDARRTEIDLWTGSGPVDLKDETGWKHVSTYIQPRRSRKWSDANDKARYLDGYVDFGSQVKTRGVRLRLVEQWLGDVHDEGPRWDVNKDKEVDPSRARMLGVAALRYLGGESSAGADPLQFQRIEQVSKQTGKITAEYPVAAPGAITTDAQGNLFCLSASQIIRLDLKGGKHLQLTHDLEAPTALAVDSRDNLYAFESKTNTIRVYDADGKFQREIGKPGGYQVGPWDPYRMQEVTSLVIDKKDQLWVVSACYWPKRIALFSAMDGLWKRDFFGNTNYGGAGILDPGDKRRLFVNRLEFEIDWETGKSHLKNILWNGATPVGEIPIYVNGAQYMVNSTDVSNGNQGVGIVYRYEKDHLRLMAAAGRADGFGPLRSGAIQRKLNGALLANLLFTWSDTNGDQVVDPDEVHFEPVPEGYIPVSVFDHQLGMAAGSVEFRVDSFLANGVPIYQIHQNPKVRLAAARSMAQTDGRKGYFVQGDHGPTGVMQEDGQWKWTYPTEGGTTQGYANAKPYWPGQMVGQFYINGHFTAHAGDLGEAFTIHTNMGSMDLITADGLLAGWIFNDQRLPGKRAWSFPEHERGMDMSDVTLGQEHFGGHVTRTSDNHYYAVVGHNHASVVEILGLDQFKRQQGTIEVTPEMVIQTQEWERSHQLEVNYVRAPVLDLYRVSKPPAIDARLDDWGIPAATIGTPDDAGRYAALRAGFDDQNLYLAYETHNMGPLKNSGEQWDRLFKTGGAVDIMLGADPAADPSRQGPVQGDRRLLISIVNKQPVAVLYDAVVPGTPDDKKWQAVSPISKAVFDNVRKISGFQCALASIGDGYVLEASIPLSEIGFKPADGQRIKMDWGILETDASGNAVMQRTYWANKATGIVADVPSEARLTPDLWGVALIHDHRTGVVELQDPTERFKKPSGGDDDTSKLLKEFEGDLNEDRKGKPRK